MTAPYLIPVLQPDAIPVEGHSGDPILDAFLPIRAPAGPVQQIDSPPGQGPSYLHSAQLLQAALSLGAPSPRYDALVAAPGPRGEYQLVPAGFGLPLAPPPVIQPQGPGGQYLVPAMGLVAPPQVPAAAPPAAPPQ